MKKVFLLILTLGIVLNCIAQGPYAPAAGQNGSTAINKDSSIFVSWASGIEINRGYVNIADTSIYYDGKNKASLGYPGYAIGKASGINTKVISLGDSGVAILTFNNPIRDGNGYDFAIFENSFNDSFLELAIVEVSSDGSNFFRFPSKSLTTTSQQIGPFDNTVDPSNLNNLAGKYRAGFGTGFDLSELENNENLDLNNIRFVKIIDAIGSIDAHFTTDSDGNKINDPFPTPFASCGFDLDGVGVINQGEAFLISDFENLTLAKDSFWNGSDMSGAFISGIAQFTNTYNSDYGNWSGFAYSNNRDDSTALYTNQYSAISGGSMNYTIDTTTNYAIAYISSDYSNNKPIPVEISTTDNVAHKIGGFYINNSTYTYLTMKNGNLYSKKFGGESGNDPDFLKIMIWGITTDSMTTDTIDFYLADYRFENNTDDYIVNNWRWVDLLSLGEITKLYFSIESSDIGDYGINTPTYFCIDNLTFYPQNTTTIENHTADNNLILYPNPSNGKFRLISKSEKTYTVKIFDINGRAVYSNANINNHELIDVSFLQKGMYVIDILNSDISSKKMFLIE